MSSKFVVTLISERIKDKPYRFPHDVTEMTIDEYRVGFKIKNPNGNSPRGYVISRILIRNVNVSWKVGNKIHVDLIMDKEYFDNQKAADKDNEI